jgi:hypothetical protein
MQQVAKDENKHDLGLKSKKYSKKNFLVSKIIVHKGMVLKIKLFLYYKIQEMI